MELATAQKGMDLKLYLIRRGMTVTSLARSIHVGRVHLSNILNGKAGLSLELTERIATTLGVSRERVQELWRGEE